jgi:hypothetical protein
MCTFYNEIYNLIISKTVWLKVATKGVKLLSGIYTCKKTVHNGRFAAADESDLNR